MKLDKRAVYKNKSTERGFKNAEYYFVKYIMDCPICLDFFVDPQVLPCGHCYCQGCIKRCSEYTKVCPMCAEFFWIFKPVQFFFAQDIKDSVLLRRCHSIDIYNSHSHNFHTYPFSLEYFEDVTVTNSEGVQTVVRRPENVSGRKLTNFIFYQSNDGQLYFLDPKISNKMKSQPLYIYGRIRERYECSINYERFPELSHIPPGVFIVVLTLHSK